MSHVHIFWVPKKTLSTKILDSVTLLGTLANRLRMSLQPQHELFGHEVSRHQRKTNPDLRRLLQPAGGAAHDDGGQGALPRQLRRPQGQRPPPHQQHRQLPARPPERQAAPQGCNHVVIPVSEGQFFFHKIHNNVQGER